MNPNNTNRNNLTLEEAVTLQLMTEDHRILFSMACLLGYFCVIQGGAAEGNVTTDIAQTMQDLGDMLKTVSASIADGRVDAAFAAGLESAATNAATTVTKAAEARASELAAADYANAAAQVSTGFDTLRPKIRPALNLDFVNQEFVDRRVVVSRAGPKSYFGKRKVLGDENLLRFSEQFDNAAWVKVNGTVTANTVTAPDGTLTAETFAATSANATVRQAVTLNGTAYSHSIYIQRLVGTGDVQLTIDGTTYSTVVVAGTWARYDITQTPASGSRNVGIRLATSGDSVAIWGAQLENRALTAYTRTADYPVRTFFNALETAAANVMPIEYDPVSQQCLGIKPESAATNLFQRSEEFDNAYWSKTNLTVTANAAIAPNGTLTADKLVATGNNPSLTRASIFPSGQAVHAIFAKRAELNFLRISRVGVANSVWFNLLTGQVGTIAGSGVAGYIKNCGGGWYLCAMISTAVLNDGAVYACTNADGASTSYTGDGYSGLYIWGAQLEASTLGVPSSYIPTTTAQVTRLADNLTVPVSEFDYNQNEGSVYVEVAGLPSIDTTQQMTIFSLEDTSQNTINLFRSDNQTGTPFQITAGNQNVSIANTSFDGTPLSAGGRFTIPFRLNSLLVYKDGTLKVTDTDFPVPNIANLRIGQNFSQAVQLNGYIRCLRYYNTALSAVEAQALSKV